MITVMFGIKITGKGECTRSLGWPPQPDRPRLLAHIQLTNAKGSWLLCPLPPLPHKGSTNQYEAWRTGGGAHTSTCCVVCEPHTHTSFVDSGAVYGLPWLPCTLFGVQLALNAGFVSEMYR